MTYTFALIPLFLLAASAILLAPATAGAQAPAKDDPGIAVITYGDLEITAILDTATTIPPGILFGRKQTDLAADLKAAGVTDGYFPGWVNAFVVKKGKETYVIDTGNGAADGFLAKMRVAGIDPATVNHVLLTHYHTDHVGGLLNPDGSKAFPKAKIYGSVEEDAYFLPPGGDGPPGAAPLPRLFAPYRGDDDYVTFSPG
ncbi:MAG: MBL fold metallo-hydrolase, partial [Deltaproteobacteria bacterium]|nr:MBL fold metallo-hydrolase [Deltaproteobacteria bacterium]